MNPNAPPTTPANGFMTSFFNPKGLLVYLTILPNFCRYSPMSYWTEHQEMLDGFDADLAPR
jgi:threonine/homoserine/homoserine lactone efflux protein